MDRRELTVFVVALIIVGTTIVSGPLVGVANLTHTESSTNERFGTGTAEINVQFVPTEGAVLQRGSFGSGMYHLEAPSARVSVGAVSGNPYLEYVIEIDALDVVDISTYVLANHEGMDLKLRFRPFEISPQNVEKAQYNGTIIVRIQSDRYREIVRADIQINVQGRPRE